MEDGGGVSVRFGSDGDSSVGDDRHANREKVDNVNKSSNQYNYN